jgi:hypothetical protein
MKNKKINTEGWLDRATTSFTGAATAAKNLGAGVAAVASGNPIKTQNVDVVKTKKLFSIAQQRITPFLNNLNNKDVTKRLNAEIQVKTHVLNFIKDYMKMTNSTDANAVLMNIYSNPNFSDIKKFLLSLKLNSQPTSSKVKKPYIPPPSKAHRIPENKNITYKEFFN